MLFANFAEAVAEGRSKAQAAALRSVKHEVVAKKLDEAKRDAPFYFVPSTELARATCSWSKPETWSPPTAR